MSYFTYRPGMYNYKTFTAWLCFELNRLRIELSLHAFSDDNRNVTDATAPPPFTLIVLVGGGVGVGLLLSLIFLHVVCFCARCCPGYRCCHSDKKSNGNC